MNLISQSKDMSKEYCATVVRLDEVKPVENSDRLGITSVQGRDIVVRRDSVFEGNIMIYVSNECQLCTDFLSKNNEFEDIEFNTNYAEVQKELDKYDQQIAELQPMYTQDDDRTVAMMESLKEARQQYLQTHKGYFSKNGRVRMKKLRGTMSMGYLIKPEMMSIYNSACEGFDWENHIGEDFDIVADKLFVKAYVPESNERPVRGVRRNKRLKKFSRMIPGQFSFHYDTQQLQTNMDRLRPNTKVNISLKEHGTSSVIGNLQVKKSKYGGLYNRFFNYLPSFLQKTVTVYDVVCSSRSVIINSDLYDGKVNVNATGAEQQEIYRWTQRLKEYIPKDITLYGEIVGYFTGITKGIQNLGGKAYDYGCTVGENMLMIYRVTQKFEDHTQEYNPDEVITMTNQLRDLLKDEDQTYAAEHLKTFTVLYDGLLQDLYPDLTSSEDFLDLLKERGPVEGESDEQKTLREEHNTVLKAELDYMYDWMSVNQKDINEFLSVVVTKDSLIYRAWQKVLLNRLKNDKNFLMEENEPMCKNKVPREGIVLKIYDDPIAEAFKLKCVRFLNKEAEDIDKGKVDSETAQRY